MAAMDPFLSVNPIANGLEHRRAKIEQARENTTRLASCYSRWQTVGPGNNVVADVFSFTCTFIAEPAFQSGFGFSEDGLEIDLTDVPRVSSGVYRWDYNARGHYVGAYVFFAIDSMNDYTLNHYLTFEGIAIKDVPDLTDL